jgi:phytoene dehydrogenase-like protein
VRSAELHPGFTTDLYSAFYPLAVASPVLRSLELERHGLRWSHAPAVLAHPRPPHGDARWAADAGCVMTAGERAP